MNKTLVSVILLAGVVMALSGCSGADLRAAGLLPPQPDSGPSAWEDVRAQQQRRQNEIDRANDAAIAKAEGERRANPPYLAPGYQGPKKYEIPVSCTSFVFVGENVPCDGMHKVYIRSYRGLASFGPAPPPSDLLVITQTGSATMAFVGNAIRREGGTLTWLGVDRVLISRGPGQNPKVGAYGECRFQRDQNNTWASIACVANDLDGNEFSVSLQTTGPAVPMDFNAPIYADAK